MYHTASQNVTFCNPFNMHATCTYELSEFFYLDDLL